MSVSKKAPNRLRRLALPGILATAIALSAGAFAAPAALAEFGINNFDVTFTEKDGTPATQAGSHPYQMETSFGVNYTGSPFEGLPDGELKDLIVGLPPGFIGNPLATPKCSTVDFFTPSKAAGGLAGGLETSCPDSTVVGMVSAALIAPFAYFPFPMFNLESAPGVAARLGTRVLGEPIVIDVGLNQEAPYNVEPVSGNVSQIVKFFGGELVLWGNPNDPSHDTLRGNCLATGFEGFGEGQPVYNSDGVCPVDNPKRAFLAVPGSCTGPAATSYVADSWQNPGVFVEGSVFTHDNDVPSNPQGFTGCEKLPFAPQISAEPSTKQAETGTGLDVNVDFDQEGLLNEAGLAQSEAKKAVVTLPAGMTINPSIGEGLGVCAPADFKRETLTSDFGEGCPGASKIGTLHIDTPIVEEGIDGSVFLAEQDDPATTAPGAENPFDSLIALYLVLKNTNLGTIIKLPLKVESDPTTGRLVATLEDIPQAPFSHFNFHFKEGTRAVLVSPPTCGTHTTKAVFYPWSDPASPRTILSDFEITSGVGGSACPSGGLPPFHPDFEAGSMNNNAGAFSPFNMRAIRSDGEQDMTKFSSILPPGELGSLAGVGKCPDSAIEAAKSKSGRQELASPSCPASSLIGHTLAGAGVGSALTYVGGQVYLGGPYHGDPLSVISVTPAVAGPFDAGTVVVRLALTLNPKTAEVEVDGANSDPIPHIIKGIVLKLRDLRVYVDRPNFTLNPTSCDESSARATLFGSYLDIFNPADDVPVDLSTRYQAANCLNLGFKPKLALQLKGGTRRGGHPGLLATYRTRSGDANLENLVVRLPRSAFLDQAHIRTICTRVQFAAKSCPPAAQYGFIKAWTPLLDTPLEGPVWLRSSNHKLPDLVFDLHGLVDIEVATRIDSAKGGIRASLEKLPDAPLSKVILRMQGGKKGLIINSRSLCGATSKADVQFGAQSGKESSQKPVMQADCGGKRKGKRG